MTTTQEFYSLLSLIYYYPERHLEIFFLDKYKQKLLSDPNHSITPNHFLNLVLGAQSSVYFNMNIEEQQASLIVYAIKNGATGLSEISRNFIPLRIKTLLLLKSAVIDKLIPASAFLRHVILSNKYDKNMDLEESIKFDIFRDLVDFSLRHGADINTIIIANKTLLHEVTSLKEFKLLESYGAKCSLFVQKIQTIIEAAELSEQDILDFPEKLYDSLATIPATSDKIPHFVHHIWLTSEDSPNEIKFKNLENTVKTKEFFANKMGSDWHHIVWTNNKSLIPSSAVFLAKNDIELRSIFDYQDQIRLIDEISALVSSKKWGIASDALRYCIIESLGGIYADLNFKFLNAPTEEVKKYDFFSLSLVNSFFAAKANHPIITHEIDMIKGIFNDSYPSLLWLKDHDDVREQTYLTTAYTFAYSVIKYFNHENNKDFVYNNGILNFEGFTCSVGLEVYKYANLMDYCWDPREVIGEDFSDGWL